MTYRLEGAKWGSSSMLGTSGGTVSWNFTGAVGAAYRAEIEAAFTRWSSVADIQFVHVQDNANAAINIAFGAIDGIGSVLGEASYTFSGGRISHADITFDSAETWTASANGLSRSGPTYFYTVALHEIGHALGLDHDDGATAVMSPYIAVNLRDLTTSDIAGIQAIYGAVSSLVVDMSKAVTPQLVLGGNGNDRLLGGSSADRMDGGAGNDALDGGAGSDIVGGGTGNDIVGGGDGNDYVYGAEGDDFVHGGAGEDLVFGAQGTDTLFGGRDSDVFYYRAGDGTDVIADFTAGNTADVIDLIGTEYGSFAQVQANLTYYGAGNASVLAFSNGSQLLIAGVRPEQLDASDFWFNVI